MVRPKRRRLMSRSLPTYRGSTLYRRAQGRKLHRNRGHHGKPHSWSTTAGACQAGGLGFPWTIQQFRDTWFMFLAPPDMLVAIILGCGSFFAGTFLACL